MTKLVRRKRVHWTPELATKFVRAVQELESCDPASVQPMNIYAKMNCPELTRENIASHLQLYRAGRRFPTADDRTVAARGMSNRERWLQDELSLSAKVDGLTAASPKVHTVAPSSEPSPAAPFATPAAPTKSQHSVVAMSTWVEPSQEHYGAAAEFDLSAETGPDFGFLDLEFA